MNVSSKVYLDLNHSFSSGLRSGQVMWHCSIYGEFLGKFWAAEVIFEFLGYLRQFLVWFQSWNLEGVNLQWTSCYLFYLKVGSWYTQWNSETWVESMLWGEQIYFLLHQYFHNRWIVIRFTTTTTNICNWLNYLRIFVSQFLLICVHFAISQTQWKKKWRTNVNYICGYREKLKQENAFCLYDLLKYLRNPINCSQQNLAF